MKEVIEEALVKFGFNRIILEKEKEEEDLRKKKHYVKHSLSERGYCGKQKKLIMKLL